MTWALVGGMMVRAHEFDHERETSFSTLDVDVLIATATRPSGESRRAAGCLQDLGFEVDHDAAYRFRRGQDQVDLLVPDSLGPATDVRTAGSGKAFEAPGGVKALEHAEWRTFELDGRRFMAPLPTLAGAILLKAYAAGAESMSRDERTKHIRDLARLVAWSDIPTPSTTS